MNQSTFTFDAPAPPFPLSGSGGPPSTPAAEGPGNIQTEIECAVCSRLEFDGGDICAACKWPLRNWGTGYGYDVCVEIRTGMVGTAQETRHYKGSEATARRRAKNVPHYLRVLAVKPLSEQQWIGAYGEGRM